ncbi:MAG: phenylacetate--CoA ligase [Candidatus Lokiarchaeota archaeon]|nr:phenylacetate--CoA ligase [Candidatus Lokiarchaeota archaeon]
MARFDYRWPKDRIQAYQQRALVAYLRDYIARYSPYYRHLFKERGIDAGEIKSLADFQRKVPVTGKEALKADPPAFVLQPMSERNPDVDVLPVTGRKKLGYALKAMRSHYYTDMYTGKRSLKARATHVGINEFFPIHTHLSGGTTGEPTPVVFTKHDLDGPYPELLGMATLTRSEPTWRGINLFPGAPHMAFYGPLIAKIQFGTPMFETFGGRVIPTDKQVMIAEKMGINTIAAIPTYLGHWLRAAVELQAAGKIKGLPGIKRVVLTAEPLPDNFRSYLEGLLETLGSKDAVLVNAWGSTECRGVFYECSKNSGIHLHPRYHFWEILHPDTLEPVGEGERGILCFTHIGWRGTVLLRYNMGDIVEKGLAWNACPACGLDWPRLDGTISRATHDVLKVKGALVHRPLLIQAIRDVPGVEAFQVVIRKEREGDAFSRDALDIHYSCKPGQEPRDVEDQVQRSVKSMVEITPSAVIHESTAAIEARLFEKKVVKADLVVDLRP